MTDRPPSPGPPPGWHADQWVPGGLRWWDGGAWTSFVLPPPAPWLVTRPTPEDLAMSRRWCGHAARAFIAMAALSTAYATVAPFLVADVADQIREGIDDLGEAPSFNPFPSLALNAAGLASVATTVVLAWWTYDATKAVRGLGRRTTHTPGWAAAGWFVPGLNLWYPYQAVRDLVPEGHPARRRVGWWWTCHLLASTAVLVPAVVAVFSVTLALVSAVFPMILALTAGGLGRRIAAAAREGLG